MKYRKKPIVVEAFKLGIHDRPAWFLAAVDKGIVNTRFAKVLIETLEGEMSASPGDWIIQGVNQELYPCKSDIFEKTYEPAE